MTSVALAVALVTRAAPSGAWVANGRCTETMQNPPLGYSRCERMRPRWWEPKTFEFGGDISLGYLERHVGDRAWRATPLGEATLHSLTLRESFLRIGPVYVGAWMDFGFGAASLRDHCGSYGAFTFGGGAFVGAHMSLGHAVLGLDLLVGDTLTRVQLDQHPSAEHAVVTPEASAVYYVHPWVAVGLLGGVDALVALDDTHVGLVLRISRRAYEGTR